VVMPLKYAFCPWADAATARPSRPARRSVEANEEADDRRERMAGTRWNRDP
jgi:hypothetical protein